MTAATSESGAKTFETCNHVATDTSETVCFEDGCTTGPMVLEGGTRTKGGDSGGPVFLWSGGYAYVRGVIVGCASDDGINCNTPAVTYIHKWTTMQSLWSLTIATG